MDICMDWHVGERRRMYDISSENSGWITVDWIFRRRMKSIWKCWMHFTNGDPDGDGINGNTIGVSAAGFVGNAMLLI